LPQDQNTLGAKANAPRAKLLFKKSRRVVID